MNSPPSFAGAPPLMPDATGPSTTRAAFDTVPATLVVMALSAVTAIGFCRVFDGWSFLPTMLFVVIATHLVALGLRLARVPAYIAIPVEVMVLASLVAWKYYPTSMSGPFPTSRTWEFLTSDLQLSRDQFPNAVAPVAAVGGFIVTASAACGVAALLADAFAFRAYGRAEAAVPSAVLFVFASALGVDNHRVAVTAAWLAAALAVIAVLRASHGRADHTWIGSRARVLLSAIPLTAVLAGCAALGGAIIGPELPGAGEKGLIKTRSKDDVTEVLSPLVDIRGRLVTLSPVELFTVDTDVPTYWRSTGLPLFDGNTFGVPDRDLRSVSGPFAESPDGAFRSTQRIVIKGLAGNFLPAAFSPVAIDSGDVFWIGDTGTLVVPDEGLGRADAFDIISAVYKPTAESLRLATTINPPDPTLLSLPGDFPDTVVDAARTVTDAGVTSYDKILLLQNWFRTQFTYDLRVQRGHGNNALDNFLRNKRGYCEQFSAAFAAMSRALDIPARVAVGFTQGDLESDGLYHVYGRNAHAWPEVWFDGIGWVPFEPTPGRGEPGAQEYTGVEPAQAVAQPGDNEGGIPITTPITAPVATTIPKEGAIPVTTLPRDGATATTAPATTAPSPGSDAGPVLLAILAIAAAVAIWAVAMPRVITAVRARRRVRSPLADIERSWQRCARALDLIDLAPHPDETALEHARRAERFSGIDRRVLRELAIAVTAATYGGVGDDETARRCEMLSEQVVHEVRSRLSNTERVSLLFDPRRAGRLIAP